MTVSNKGIVFNIQYFSVHDGPGIRTVIFLKGCPLECLWCANPESQKREREIAWQESKCLGCKRCQTLCPNSAIYEKEGICIKRQSCITCFLCTEGCPSGALYQIGEYKTVEELLLEVEKDEVFYSNSKGGLTLSGGEPLFQGEFAIALLKEAKKRHINTAMETTGFAKWETLQEAAGYLDSLFYDIKCVDDEKHRYYTGVSNHLILENFYKLCKEYKKLPITVRTPIIPGVNDSKEEVYKILDIIKPYDNVKYELLSYHAFGVNKYKNLGRTYPMPEVKMEKGSLEELRALIKEKGKEA